MSMMRFIGLGRRPFDLALRGAGANSFGELSRTAGQVSVLTAPAAPVTDPQKWAQFSFIGTHSAALHTDGRLYTAGDNLFGQLAQGNFGRGPSELKDTFTQVGVATNWVKVGAGSEHTAALNALGEVWTAGRNNFAQCGDGTVLGTDYGSGNFGRPTFYNTATTPAPFFPAGKRWIDLSVGHRFNLVMDTDREIWSWGNNGSAQLGHDSVEDGGPAGEGQGFLYGTYCKRIFTPGPWRKMQAGGYHAAAIHDSTGELWTWGLTADGQRSTFTGVNSVGAAQFPCNVPSLRWVDFSCGEYSLHLLRSDGTLWACGRNIDGQLGIGTYTSTATLTQVAGDWVFVSAGFYHTLAIGLDGQLYGWGRNLNRQLGSASLTAGNYNTPQLISADTVWNAAYAGEAGSFATRIIV